LVVTCGLIIFLIWIRIEVEHRSCLLKYPFNPWYHHYPLALIIHVATLTLGSWPRQGFARLRAKREAGSHTTYSRECEKVWGNEPSHPKGVPLWELESRWTFEFLEGDWRGQNSMDWGDLYIIWKLFWELEFQWTPEFLEDNCRGRTSMDWSIYYIIRKILECRCLKWAYITHLDIWNTSYGQKKGQESNW
jgi:hypothetical protein